MVDTYRITPDSLTNDETERWTQRYGYNEMEKTELIEELDNGLRTGDFDRSTIDQLSQDKDVLVRITSKRVTVRSRRQRRLASQISDTETRIEGLENDRELLVGDDGLIAETREDLDALREERNELQEQNRELRDERDELREEREQLQREQEIKELVRRNRRIDEIQSRIDEIQSQIGVLNNRIGNLNTTIEDTEDDIEDLEQRRSLLDEDIDEAEQQLAQLRQELSQAEPDTALVDTIDDLVLVCTVEFETYIHGIYEGDTGRRVIEGVGDKVFRVGARAPIQVREDNDIDEDEFWNDIYDDTRTEIIEDEGTSDPGGEWFSRLIRALQEIGDNMAMTAAVNFIDDNWTWFFGPAQGSHDFPSGDPPPQGDRGAGGRNLQQYIQTNCTDINDVRLRTL